MTTPLQPEQPEVSVDPFSDEFLAFATTLHDQEPELWKEFYDRGLMPKLCKVHVRLLHRSELEARKEQVMQDFLSLINDSNEDEAVLIGWRDGQLAELQQQLTELERVI